MKRLNGFFVVLGMVLAVAACNRESAIVPGGDSIVIGVIAPTEGLQGFKGRQAIAGMRWALQLYPYTDGGTAVKLLVVATEDEPVAVSEALQQLAEDVEVVAVVSLADSDAMLAAAPVANRLAIPVLAASATNPDIVKGGPFVSQVIYDDAFQGAVAALFVRDELLIKKVAVVSNPENAHSRYLAERFGEKFEAIGGEITRQLFLAGAAGDYSAELAGLKQDEPELIYMTVGTEKLLQIGVALRKLKWKPRLMGPDGSLSALVAQFPERIKLFEGMLATDVYTSRAPLTRMGEEYGDLSREVLDELDTYSVLGIEAVAIIIDAIEKCGEAGATRNCIAGRVRQTRDFAGILGRITIDENGRAIRPLVINSIKKGEIVYRLRVH
jgi:branched-chain amino acid transport system substrate-binding protein